MWDNDGRAYFKCVDGPVGPTDPCSGIQCPSGQHCENGVCVDSGGGGGGTTNPSAGIASVKVGQAQYLDLHESGAFSPQYRTTAKNNAVYNHKDEHHKDVENVKFVDGNIVLKVSGIAYNVKNDDGQTINAINSGSIMSNSGYKKGVFMITATVPKCNNLFPAIWLTAKFKNSNSDNPCYIEIDIMETMQHTDSSNPNATANLVFPSYGNDGKCTYSNVLRTMNKKGQGYRPMKDKWGSYKVQENTWKCNTSSNDRRTWDKHTFVLYWDEKTIMNWVDPNYNYNASTGLISITPKNSNSFISYTYDSTSLWRDSYKNIGSNPFDQKLNIVMNIASSDKISYNAPGSQMTISKVLYFPLMA